MIKQEIMEKIDKLYYWDARIIHLSCEYFSDEVVLIYEDSEEENIEIIFSECYSVIFDHDLTYKKSIPYRSLSRSQILFFSKT